MVSCVYFYTLRILSNLLFSFNDFYHTERIIVVSEYTGRPLSEIDTPFNFDEKICISHQIVKALHHLHSENITHRNLSLDNILVDSKNNVKLFNYGLYYMTGEGKDVSFPIG